MAGIEIRGFDELRRNTERLCRAIEDEAVRAAEDAAAAVIKAAVRASAPRRTGALAASVAVFEGKDRRALTGLTRRRLLVGPEKRKGYYGYFVEHGWLTAGSRRRARAAQASTHGQKGAAAARRIPPKPWFARAAATVEVQAWEAGRRAFEEAVERELHRMG